MLIATAVAVSLQLEAGALMQRNPTDDQYVDYHNNNNSSYGVQMTSPSVGAAVRFDVDRAVLTLGARDMGHQYIDSDVISDYTYFNCRYKNDCPKPTERWYTRMSLYQAYASVGYKLHVDDYTIVPTAGISETRVPTSVEVTFPYCLLPGHAPVWYRRNNQDQPHTFVGVDVEHGRYGLGVYALSLNRLPTQMGDPGEGASGVLVRLTVRFGGGL